MEMSAFIAIFFTTLILASIAVMITFAGVWLTLQSKEKPAPWSDGVKVFWVFSMMALTIFALRKLQTSYSIDDYLPYIYTGFIVWYIFLFVFAKPSFVRYFRS